LLQERGSSAESAFYVAFESIRLLRTLDYFLEMLYVDGHSKKNNAIRD